MPPGATYGRNPFLNPAIDFSFVLRSLQTPPSSHKHIPVIGIVGGVGAGKSSVVRLIKSLRLHLIDADTIGHAQLRKESIRDAIVQAFGKSVLDQQDRWIEKRWELCVWTISRACESFVATELDCSSRHSQ